MTKKISKMSMIAIGLALLCIVSLFVIAILPKAHPERVHLMANWTDQQDTFAQAYENANAVLIGKVKSINSYEDRNVIFSMVEVETTSALKGQVNDVINVLFTGGVVNNIEYYSEESKLPELDQTYLFVLRERNNINEYVPIGGYQGVFAISNNDVKSFQPERQISPVYIQPFNQNNKLEQELKGKDIVKEFAKISGTEN